MGQQLPAPGARSLSIVGSSLAWLSPLSFAAPKGLPSSATALTFLPGRLLSRCCFCFQGFSQTIGPFQDPDHILPYRTQSLP